MIHSQPILESDVQSNHYSQFEYLQDILVDDEIWEQGVLESVDVDGNASLSSTSNLRAWSVLTEADFSRNDLPYIDESVVSIVMCIQFTDNK